MSELKGRGAAWAEERSDEGRRPLQAPRQLAGQQTTVTLSAASGPGVAGRWREWRNPLLIIVVVLLAGVAIALLQSPAVTGYLSPDSTGADGARAIADILSERGHSVQPVTTVPAAVGAAASGTTLVITSPYLLTTGQLDALARTRANLVVAEPDQDAVAALAPRLSLGGSAAVGVLLPGCALPAATLAGGADMGGPGLRVRPGRAGVTLCYFSGGLATLAQFRSDGRLVTVLSTGIPLTNGYLAQQGNAALAINLLSSGGRVIWLVPPVPAATGTSGGGSPSFLSLVPFPVYLVAIQLALAVLLTALWRARRLGPLAAERLPVVVRASETVEGHARLYQSRHARDRVAATLRAATVTRLAPAVGLSASAAPAAVTAALAARSTLDEARIADLLYGAPPGSDAALVTLASDLDALEGEVRR
jgi:hypothetical protein